MEKKTIKTVAQNKKAYHDYYVEEKWEAGIALFGTEVKSLRCSRVNLKDSYCRIVNNEIFATDVHISPYEMGNIFNRDPMRDKKLLMHKKEILKIKMLTEKQGYTIVPLSIYFSGKNAKMEIGLCRGKKLYDKREAEAKKQAMREIERERRYEE